MGFIYTHGVYDIIDARCQNRVIASDIDHIEQTVSLMACHFPTLKSIVISGRRYRSRFSDGVSGVQQIIKRQNLLRDFLASPLRAATSERVCVCVCIEKSIER